MGRLMDSLRGNGVGGWGWFSPFVIWVLEIELGLSDLVARVFTC